MLGGPGARGRLSAAGAPLGPADTGAPVNFFSVEGQAASGGLPGANGQRKKRRRRRRRGRGGRPEGSGPIGPNGGPISATDGATGHGAPNGSSPNGAASPTPRTDGPRDPD